LIISWAEWVSSRAQIRRNKSQSVQLLRQKYPAIGKLMRSFLAADTEDLPASIYSRLRFLTKPQSPLAFTWMFCTFFFAMTMFDWYHNGNTGTSRLTIA